MPTSTSTPPAAAPAAPALVLDTAARYRVSIDQYRFFRQNGYLVVRTLVPPSDIVELREHTEELMQGRLPEQRDTTATDGEADGNDEWSLPAPPTHLSDEERASFFLRIHMLHRHLALHERMMLHPRVLDVLESIIGPDVLALQTMLFLKGPGQPGQGWHQDSYYIPTQPDSLCGAWIAIDDCDERNGAMWMAVGSAAEPVYPPKSGYGFGTREIDEIPGVEGVSRTNDAENGLTPVADRYPQVLIEARAGDVVFFNGHILHRSKANHTADRFRRAFVSHYCNARAYTAWGADEAARDGGVNAATAGTNRSHILARGDTHLEYQKPRYGTPCAALLTAEERKALSRTAQAALADMDSGLMGGESGGY